MNEIITTDHERAVSLHRRIMTDAQIAQESLYDMCTALKEMRDGKLYRELGYSEFNDYCQTEIGISDRQVYKYIAIADKLSADLVNPGSLIGVKKLYLLTTITEEQRTEIVENTDLENTTVRELQAQIAQLKEESELDRKERDNANAAAQRWKDNAKRVQEEKEKAEAAAEEARKARDAAQQTNAELQDQIADLESRPVEIAVPEPSHEVQNLQDAMRRINLEHEQWSAQIQDEHIKQVQEIHKKHRAETDALRAEYEEKLAAAQAAPAEVPEPDSKEVFKAYLANVIDAAKRMTAFLAAHPNDACRAQAEKFFQTMIGEVST